MTIKKTEQKNPLNHIKKTQSCHQHQLQNFNYSDRLAILIEISLRKKGIPFNI